MRKITFSLAATLAAVAFSSGVWAADAPAPTPAPAASAAHMKRGPSPAALAACSGKAEGAAASWTGKSGAQRTGTCVMHHGQLAAHGAHKARGPRPSASAPAS